MESSVIMDKSPFFLKDIDPNLRRIIYNHSSKGLMAANAASITFYTYFMVYIYKGRGSVIVGNRTYRADEGDIFFVPPGVPRTIISDTSGSMHCMGIHFDLTQNFRNQHYNGMPNSKEDFIPSAIGEKFEFKNFKLNPGKLITHDMLIVRQLVLSIYEQYIRADTYWQRVCNNLLRALILILIQSQSSKYSSQDNVSLGAKITSYLLNNYLEPITNASVAKHFGYSVNHLNRILKAYANTTIKQYILDLKLSGAAYDLTHTKLPIIEIADKYRFETVSYFSCKFREKYELTPTQYRLNPSKI